MSFAHPSQLSIWAVLNDAILLLLHRCSLSNAHFSLLSMDSFARCSFLFNLRSMSKTHTPPRLAWFGRLAIVLAWQYKVLPGDRRFLDLPQLQYRLAHTKREGRPKEVRHEWVRGRIVAKYLVCIQVGCPWLLPSIYEGSLSQIGNGRNDIYLRTWAYHIMWKIHWLKNMKPSPQH